VKDVLKMEGEGAEAEVLNAREGENEDEDEREDEAEKTEGKERMDDEDKDRGMMKGHKQLSCSTNRYTVWMFQMEIYTSSSHSGTLFSVQT
jgi:hypothetical protein